MIYKYIQDKSSWLQQFAMEKEKQQSKLKNKILKILPKTVTVTFQNPPFSPGRDHRFKSHVGNGNGNGKGYFFSGPMIPDEARRKPKDDGATVEPTSPKISCMGQIKHKKKHVKKGAAAKNMSMPPRVRDSVCSTPGDTGTEEKKQSSRFQRMLFYAGKPKPAARKKSDAVVGETGPPLGQMRRFASSRETFSNFDWKTQIAPEERDCYSDIDDRVESDGEDDVIIPFSAPLTVGGAAGVPNLQPRKEINIWKRRTMAPPRPLQLNPVLTAK